MPNLENPIGQLHKKLPDLQKSPEVSDAVEKYKRLTDEKVPNTPEARLEVYMERLEKVFLNEDEDTRKRNISLLRPKIHEAFVIKREDVPESYFELQQRIARERGQPVETIPENVREQMKDVIIEDQTQSLDAWIDYLSSDDAMYPTWFKYFVFRNITKLSQFDKEHGKFKDRTKSTTAPFPDIYREPLAQVCDMYERVAKGDPATLNDPSFQEFIGKKFPAQYAMLIQKTLEQAQESREQIQGKWVKYEQGDMEGAEKLYDSLQGKGTGWCTAGESTAKAQLKSGDFYVYYTNDEAGNPVNPRLAIRMSDEKIGEVRGVLHHQEVEPLLQDVLDVKLSEFGSEADSYKKKSADMRRLTQIDNSFREGEELSKDDLKFLYEIDSYIEGFGYRRDSRIEELTQGRDVTRDLKNIFGTNVRIAKQHKEVDDSTDVLLIGGVLYTKPRNKELFANLIHCKRIQRSFDEGIPLTKEDLVFIYGEAFGRNTPGYDIKSWREKITPEMIQNVLGLEAKQIAKDFDDISEETVLYLPQIQSFLNEKPVSSQYDRNKADHEECLKNEKILRRIAKNLSNHKTLSQEELRFVYSEHGDKFAGVGYSYDRKGLEEKDLREKIDPANLEAVFGEDISRAISNDIPRLLESWANRYNDNPSLAEGYFPFIERKSDGAFMICTGISIYSLTELENIDAELRTRGYKLANKSELTRFLERGNLTLLNRKEEYTTYSVYGRDSLWTDYLNGKREKNGAVLSYEDKKLENEGIVPILEDENDPNSQWVLIAITKAENDLRKYDVDEGRDDALDAIEDKAFQETRKK